MIALNKGIQATFNTLHGERIFYAAVNYCLRGMVTGCDNILDDAYKMTIATDLPLKASKFRSIYAIKVLYKAALF